LLARPGLTHGISLEGHLPGARTLRDYRIGFGLDDPFCPVTPEVAEPLRLAVEALRKAGVDLEEGWPAGVNPGDFASTSAAAPATCGVAIDVPSQASKSCSPSPS
jgi:hypothetical protein